MLIGKDWKITSDNMNVVLSQSKFRKSKLNIRYKDWEIVGYYPTVKDALKALVDFGVKGTELKDLQSIVKKQDELYKLIDGLKE